jgi:UDP-N-acetylglucosamine 2-epimerase
MKICTIIGTRPEILKMSNPYGDGRTSEKIIEILSELSK